MKNDNLKNEEELRIIKKNDNYMVTANSIFILLLVVTGVLGIISAVLIFKISITAGVFTLIILAFIEFIAYIFFRLFMSFLFDVKMIRNKLYDMDNEMLYMFYKSTNKSKQYGDMPEFVKEENPEEKQDNQGSTQDEQNGTQDK